MPLLEQLGVVPRPALRVLACKQREREAIEAHLFDTPARRVFFFAKNINGHEALSLAIAHNRAEC